MSDIAAVTTQIRELQRQRLLLVLTGKSIGYVVVVLGAALLRGDIRPSGDWVGFGKHKVFVSVHHRLIRVRPENMWAFCRSRSYVAMVIRILQDAGAAVTPENVLAAL